MNIFHAVRDILAVSVVAHIRLLECSWSIVLGNALGPWSLVLIWAGPLHRAVASECLLMRLNNVIQPTIDCG